METHIKKVLSYTVPMYGNKRNFPYAKLLVDGLIGEKVIYTKEDANGSYITYNRRRYAVFNEGSLYSPKLTLVPEAM